MVLVGLSLVYNDRFCGTSSQCAFTATAAEARPLLGSRATAVISEGPLAKWFRKVGTMRAH